MFEMLRESDRGKDDALDSAAAEPIVSAPDSVPNSSFREHLQRLRLEMGMSLQQMANELGVSKVTLWKWERGQARPRQAHVANLARVLKISPDWILAGRSDGERGRMALPVVISTAKAMIAQAAGTEPAKVRISIEY